jgi:Uma2 family endonuclease
MTTAKPPAIAPETTLPYRLALNISAVEMTEEQFLKLCSDNGDLRMELTAKRELIIMPPAGLTTSHRNAKLNYQLVAWSHQDGTGITFDSSGGFTLPNGAVLSPDASWILLSRWESLSRAEQDRFAPICPDFVIELRSPSDSLAITQEKMAEYLENGVRLGWLIDPRNKRVYVYRPGQPVETLDGPDTVSGEPALSGFVLDLRVIW